MSQADAERERGNGGASYVAFTLYIKIMLELLASIPGTRNATPSGLPGSDRQTLCGVRSEGRLERGRARGERGNECVQAKSSK